MKKVGIIMRKWKYNHGPDIPLCGFRYDLFDFLRRYNVSIIAIPIDFEHQDVEFKKLKSIVDECDGVVFPGGAGTAQIDYEVIKYLYEIDRPVLGICLGMQIMAKAYNGEVISKFDNAKHNNTSEYVHKLKINKESLLFDIVQKNEILVNSRHTNYIPFTNFNVGAYSEDNIIEEIEDKNKKFFLGVQWHPESLPNAKNSINLFDRFISSL